MEIGLFNLTLIFMQYEQYDMYDKDRIGLVQYSCSFRFCTKLPFLINWLVAVELFYTWIVCNKIARQELEYSHGVRLYLFLPYNDGDDDPYLTSSG